MKKMIEVKNPEALPLVLTVLPMAATLVSELSPMVKLAKMMERLDELGAEPLEGDAEKKIIVDLHQALAAVTSMTALMFGHEVVKAFKGLEPKEFQELSRRLFREDLASDPKGAEMLKELDKRRSEGG